MLVDVYFKVREVQKEPYYKEPLAEDFTPRVPIVSDWYERNKGGCIDFAETAETAAAIFIIVS